ncbi:hypothetical protein CYMTET_41146 [Cymbomonas tetramitiformis]|uniref:Uncharacterized protein n=1 Tax=Cymbomonas tetramitiformis TaxID=36881 RepID=A0AAE0C814_9CHLO|nr:hypothetical protein CYMTET_41146 [Cymbomonas tetramitiformis]
MPPPPPPPAPPVPGTNLVPSYKEQQKTALVSREVRWEDKFPLHCAAQCGSVPRLREMLGSAHWRCPAVINALDDDTWSPLHYSAWYGWSDCARMLLACGADHTVANLNGGTPLHFAAGCGQLELVRVLLEAGADPAICNHDKMTPSAVARDLQPRQWQTVKAVLDLCFWMMPKREQWHDCLLGLKFIPRNQSTALTFTAYR